MPTLRDSDLGSRLVNRRRLLGAGGAIGALALVGCGPAGGAANEAAGAAAPAASSGEIGLAIGDRLPEFEVESLAGGTHKLADYAGRPLFLNFWATWCGPCRIELPEMEAIWTEKTYGDLVIVAISVGERRDTVEKFVAEEIALSFDVGLDPEGDSTNRYRIVGMPTSYFVDRDGVVRDVNIGGMNGELMGRRISSIADPA
ncbi:MAG: TlpA disulfide reductase family protein [Chloroflexota bacterium]|jgi:thiol-disulfide isomerase/thioredoxin|nr:TlpA disulfide reductase family protein [Chloroflexota bacterium]